MWTSNSLFLFFIYATALCLSLAQNGRVYGAKPYISKGGTNFPAGPTQTGSNATFEDDEKSLNTLFELVGERITKAGKAGETNDGQPRNGHMRTAAAKSDSNAVGDRLDDLFNKVKTSLKSTRIQDIQDSTATRHYFTPVWEQSTAHLERDCSKQKCELVLKNFATRELSTLTIDAVGNVVANTTDLKEAEAFAEDARNAQRVIRALKEVQEMVKSYNSAALEMNMSQSMSPLRFFMEIVDYRVGICVPDWTWTHNIRAFVQMNLGNFLPSLGWSIPVSAYTGSSHIDEPLVPFVWTPRDERRGDIGEKKVYGIDATWDFRTPMEEEFTDVHGIFAAGLFRAHSLLKSLETNVNSGTDSRKGFLDVSSPILRDAAWVSPNSGGKSSFCLLWMVNFPISGTFHSEGGPIVPTYPPIVPTRPPVQPVHPPPKEEDSKETNTTSQGDLSPIAETAYTSLLTTGQSEPASNFRSASSHAPASNLRSAMSSFRSPSPAHILSAAARYQSPPKSAVPPKPLQYSTTKKQKQSHKEKKPARPNKTGESIPPFKVRGGN